jgi:hypothetical protein
MDRQFSSLGDAVQFCREAPTILLADGFHDPAEQNPAGHEFSGLNNSKYQQTGQKGLFSAGIGY